MSKRVAPLMSVALLLLALPMLGTCTTDSATGPAGPAGPPGPPGPAGQPLGYLEGNNTRVVFPRNELWVINKTGVLLNLEATDGGVGFRFYKDFPSGSEQQTNPWSIWIEGIKGYQGLAVLRDWLFTATIWEEEGRMLVGRLHPHPPANAPANARFQVRGTVNEVQAMVEAAENQTAEIFQVVSNGTQGTRTPYFSVGGRGHTVIGSPAEPKEIILYDTADRTPYALRITNGQLVITKVN